MPTQPDPHAPPFARAAVPSVPMAQPALLASAVHTLCDEGRPAEALEVAAALMREHPNFSAGQVALGRALFESGDVSRAADVLRAASIHFPASVAAHRWLAEVLLGQGHAARARAVLKQASILSPRNQRINQLLRLAGEPEARPPVAAEARPLISHSEEETTTRVMEFPLRPRDEAPRPPPPRTHGTVGLPGHDDPTVSRDRSAALPAGAAPTPPRPLGPPPPPAAALRPAAPAFPAPPPAPLFAALAPPMPPSSGPSLIHDPPFEPTPSVTWRLTLPVVAGRKLSLRLRHLLIAGAALLALLLWWLAPSRPAIEPAVPDGEPAAREAEPAPAGAEDSKAPPTATVPRPPTEEGPLARAAAALEAADPAGARRWLDRAGTASRGSRAFAILEARVQEAAGVLLASTRAALEACASDQRHPDDSSACLRLLATHERRRGNRGQARTLARRGAGLPSHDPALLAASAQLLANLGETALAQRQLERAREHAHRNLGALAWAAIAVSLGSGKVPSQLPSPLPAVLTPEERLLMARLTHATQGPAKLGSVVASFGPGASRSDDDLRWYGLLARHLMARDGVRFSAGMRASATQIGPVAAYVSGLLAQDHRHLALAWFKQALAGHGDQCRAGAQLIKTLQNLGKRPDPALLRQLGSLGCESRRTGP